MGLANLEQTRSVAASAADRLLEVFQGHRLSPTQRRIAQYLLEHPGDVALLSSVDLARRVGVSQPSVTRFAAALSFERYADFRRKVGAIVMGAAQQPPEEVRRNEFAAAVGAEVRNLEGLSSFLADPSTVVRLGRDLARSRPLTVVGLRVSAGLATYFGYCARKVHPDVHVITQGGSLLDDTIALGHRSGGTWLLCFAMPRYPTETVEAMRFARSLGMKVAVVADQPLASVADVADVLLPAAVSTLLVFDSHAAPMVLATVLLQAMCDAMPDASQRQLEELEQINVERRTFHTA